MNIFSPKLLDIHSCKDQYNNLIEIAKKISSPIISTLPAAGIVNYGFPFEMGILGHSGNQYASQLLKEADLIIKLTATWWPTDYTPKKPNIIQFDTIRENIGASHPVTLGIPGDISLSLPLLKSKLNEKNNQNWIDKIKKIKTKWSKEINHGYTKKKWPLAPSQIIKVISEKCNENDIITRFWR